MKNVPNVKDWRKARRPVKKTVKPVEKPVPATVEEEPAPIVPVNMLMAGHIEQGVTHKVSLVVSASNPGPNIIAMEIAEARLLARSLMEWAQYAEDRLNGKR